MNANQKNRVNRGWRVKSCVERSEFTDVLNEFPGFPDSKASLDANLEGLIPLEKRQFTTLKGHIATKKSGRTVLTPMCLQLSVAMVALATFTGNSALLDKVACSATSLKKLTYAKLIVFAQTLLDLGSENRNDLVAYHIQDQFYDAMETAISALNAAMLAELTARDEQKQITVEIEQALKEIGEIQSRFALMAETLRESQPVFYEIFKAAYHLGDVSGNKLSAFGNVIDADTGEALSKCRLKITSFEPLVVPPAAGEDIDLLRKSTPSFTDMMKSVKLTSIKGRFRYRNLPNGSYELTAFRAGFAEIKVTFFVNTGVTTEVNISLQKVADVAA